MFTRPLLWWFFPPHPQQSWKQRCFACRGAYGSALSQEQIPCPAHPASSSPGPAMSTQTPSCPTTLSLWAPSFSQSAALPPSPRALTRVCWSAALFRQPFRVWFSRLKLAWLKSLLSCCPAFPGVTGMSHGTNTTENVSVRRDLCFLLRPGQFQGSLPLLTTLWVFQNCLHTLTGSAGCPFSRVGAVSRQLSCLGGWPRAWAVWATQTSICVPLAAEKFLIAMAVASFLLSPSFFTCAAMKCHAGQCCSGNVLCVGRSFPLTWDVLSLLRAGSRRVLRLMS